MRVAQAFQLAVDALVDASGLSAIELAEKAGVDDTTISRWRKGDRFPGLKYLELLRAGLGVHPRELFDPEAANEKLAAVKAGRLPDTVRRRAHTLDLGGLPDPESVSHLGGVIVSSYENAHALAELLDQWRRLTPEARMSLVLESVRLAKTPGTAAAKAR